MHRPGQGPDTSLVKGLTPQSKRELLHSFLRGGTANWAMGEGETTLSGGRNGWCLGWKRKLKCNCGVFENGNGEDNTSEPELF